MVQISASGTVTVQRMVDLIEKAYSEKITLNTVAAALRTKPDYLGRVFRAVVGMSVHEYVTRVRLEQAAHLIGSGIKIEAVALTVGYQSKKNFYRQFIRHFGLTPETYRWRRGNGSDRRARAGNNVTRVGMNTYTAAFDDTQCLIDVEVRPNVKGRSSYVATPFVVLSHGVQPFATTSDHVEITGETEADALERAATFLEHRFGNRSATPKRQNGTLRTQQILSPRR